MINPDARINELVSFVKTTPDERKKKEVVINFIRELPPDPSALKAYELAFDLIGEIKNHDEKRAAILEFIGAIPPTGDFLPVYMKAMEPALKAIEETKDPIHGKSAFVRLAHDMPEREEFAPLYSRAMKLAIDAADRIPDNGIRRYSLVDIAGKLRAREGSDALAIHAYRVALGISSEAGYKKYSLQDISKELPKSSDYAFYRSQTFLGITIALPKKGEFLKLYREAIKTAMKAAILVEEPYYRKYALLFIAQELPKTEEFLALYKESLEEAFNAASAIKEPFTRQFAFLEILQEVPKTEYFSPLIFKTIEASLPFFSVRSRMQDVEVVEVIDYLIVAEEKKISDSKKRRAIRAKYAQDFSRQLEEVSSLLNDIRFLEILRPYTHVWIRPEVFRDTVKKVVESLSALKTIYHGREIERPVFVKEEHPGYGSHLYLKDEKAAAANETFSIDLGATNTVIMRKRGEANPEFVAPDDISRRYGDIYIIPTLITPETDSIGAEAEESANALNIKKMLLEGAPGGKDLMERYISVLYRHLKKSIPPSGWFSAFSGKSSTGLCITVPVGFQDYRVYLRNIMKRVAKGVRVDFIEEPLAAAIGYQVAGKKDKLLLVMDFGGCTLDTMLLRLNIDEVHVVAKPDRSILLGGKDIDIWLSEHLKEKCGLAGEDIHPQLLMRAEEIKIALSQYKIVPFEWDGKEVCKVTRDDFEKILEEHDFYKAVDRAASYVLKKAKKLGITKEILDAVLLTGGSSQIPSFKEKISHLFPELAGRNAIYDHSPLTAVAMGAALYGTRGVIDRHLGMAYALRFATRDKEKHHYYEVVLEKGDSLPFEKTFRLKPGRTLGAQKEVFLELFEVPENLVTRRWVKEADMEFIKQVLKSKDEAVELKGFKIVTLPLEDGDALDATLCVDEAGNLRIRYGRERKELDAGIRLQ